MSHAERHSTARPRVDEVEERGDDLERLAGRLVKEVQPLSLDVFLVDLTQAPACQSEARLVGAAKRTDASDVSGRGWAARAFCRLADPSRYRSCRLPVVVGVLEVPPQRATNLGGQAAIGFEHSTLELGTLLHGDLRAHDDHLAHLLHRVNSAIRGVACCAWL
jgi:hypothetical protein